MSMSIELMHNAFPKLTDDEMDQLVPYASCEHYNSGDMLFMAGQPDIDMFIVRSGKLEILNPHDDDAILVVHEAGQFSGDIDLLTRRPVNVSGRAKGATHVMRVSNEKLREILHRIPLLSETLLSAFQLRRMILEKSGKMGLKVLGHAQCRDTTEVRELFPFSFMTSLQKTENECRHSWAHRTRFLRLNVAMALC
jgi:thioredoxin reductase (NADPH)